MATTRALSIDERIRIPDGVFDLDGYRAWVTSNAYPERVRTTYIGGEVLIDMSPESLERHNKVKTAVTADLVWFVRDRDLGEVYSDRTLLTHVRAGLSAEPDLTFVSWSAFERERVIRTQRAGTSDDDIELVGSPDLVVEIVSDTSVQKDTVMLRQAYARAGVEEYWLIDARGDELEFAIFRNEQGSFQASGAPRGPQQSLVLGGSWTLTRTTNRIGHFAYRLTHTD